MINIYSLDSIFGGKATLQNKNNSGKGMAIAGIVCSGIALVVYVIGLVFGTIALSTLF